MITIPPTVTTCAGLNAFVASGLDAAIEERAALLAGDAWDEYLRRQDGETSEPEAWDPDRVRAGADIERAEAELAYVVARYQPYRDAAARCTRAASLVGVRNGAIVMILGGLAILGIARIRPTRRD